MAASGTPWFRAYSQLRNHPKMKLLARHLNRSKTMAIGHIIQVWCWATDYFPDGDVPASSLDELEIEAGWIRPRGRLVQALIASRLAEQNSSGIKLHNFMLYAESYKRALKQQKRREDREPRTPTVPLPCPDRSATVPPERKGKEQKGKERNDATPKPTEPAVEEATPKPKAPISSVSSFSSLSDIASQLVPLEHEPETDEAEEGSEIETVGEFLDACAKLDIKTALTDDSHDRLRDLLRQAPISADDFRFATNKAIRNNKRTAGYVAGTIRGRRIDARDQKATPPKKTPPESPGNGASSGARLPLYKAEPPPSPEQQEANARAAKAYGEKLREQWNGN